MGPEGERGVERGAWGARYEEDGGVRGGVGELTNLVNEAGADGGWGPRQEGQQQAGGRGTGGCGGGECRSVLNTTGWRGRDGGEDQIYDPVAPTWSSDELVIKL